MPLPLWLAILFALVVAMIVVGGMTRLTDSGLSITEWRPVTGAVPPTSEAAWATEFDKYRATPQFELMNRDMTLPAFKSIYWWEWSHRQLGRAIGAVWLLGFVWFWARGLLPPRWTPRLLTLGVLGGLQGAIGWWMVASGLTGAMVSVASYRLAVHLGLAFLILGLINLVRAAAAPGRGRSAAGTAPAQPRADRLGHGADGDGLRAGGAGGAGRGDRRRTQLHRLAADGRRSVPLDCVQPHARLDELP